ncbi:Mannosyl-glycoprotein endo-beta-N-acetylglucosaminidase [Handroanthus impetiginosus]|uniref:mannosyl-glycoprotein endo-beta-N-acetylglucosaminidase n=1 Tax=Handroanthus impetiginosus TaxID=429701 RepID=A0A2G9HAN1_9LAMI|nr:Mannosyl-glycoprotein endo-beta-N-acetylglucosaminidase [Handroanthus impetiginosus]
MPLSAYIKTHHPTAFSTLKNLGSFLSTIMENTAARDNQDGSSGANTDQPFDPSLPAIPISYPLEELEELESRAYFKSFHYPFNQASVKLPSAELPRRPRILVCHDMKGGYTSDDKLVQGGTNPDAYAIWHWYLIDVFVYFSHHLVTLPPPCWINAPHRHGVKVLGTFIMEGGEGKKRAGKLLSSRDSAQMYAERLSELAVALGFDGWLINMEVTLDTEQIPNLKAFVNHLSRTMHASVRGSLVIWYDSVTIDGDLSWQNQLNDKNKPFFDLCDGIFTNYWWEEDFPKLSGSVAGDRKFDVYMGIDVFGRGTFGGGQWTTNVALDVIKKDDVSAAIFAPGWVHETNQPPDFQTAQKKWWGLVEKSWGTVQKYPKALPFYSNFDQGHGYHIYSDGKQISGTSWNNISSQSFQPFLEYSGDSTAQPIQASVNFKEASYNGGGKIIFTGTLGHGAEFRTRLFQGEVLFGSSPVYVTYSVKSKANSLLGFALEFSSATEEKKSILLAASGNTLLTMNQFSSCFTSVIMPRRVTKLEKERGWVIQESSISMPGHILKEIRAICYKSNTENSIATSQYHAALGDIKITTTGKNSKFPPSDSWLVDGEFVSWTSGSQGSKRLSVKIVWRLKVGNADLFPKYNLYVGKITGLLTGNESGVLESANEYVGVAVVKSFYVSDLEVPSGTSGLKFIIQVCGLDGAMQKLEDSPFLLLQVQGT